jgi:hypothetical protein
MGSILMPAIEDASEQYLVAPLTQPFSLVMRQAREGSI